MKNKIFLLLLYSIISLHAYSQPLKVPVDFSPEGGNYNQAMISDAFLQTFGEKQVTYWLQNKIIIRSFWDVDALGRVQRVRIHKSSKSVFPSQKEDSLNLYIKKNRMYLRFWYYEDPEIGLNTNQRQLVCQEILREIKKQNYKSIYVVFNNDLVSDYQYSKVYPNIIEYLKAKIRHYKKYQFP